MNLLIDTEILLFQAAAACEFEAEWQPDVWTYACRIDDARALLQDSIAALIAMAPDSRPTFCMSSPQSFRYGIWPSYKEHRKKNRKPAGWQALSLWLESTAPNRGWQLQRLPDVEADDVLGIMSQGNIIASIDKDLRTIPGVHLHMGTLKFEEVTTLEADRNFYSQTLIGDTSDNYPGCPGVGKATAEKILAPCRSDLEMWEAVKAAYAKKGIGEQAAITQARCARILRPGEYDLTASTVRLWQPPVA